ncbi:unnamed protein product, partial [Meganyctiphanes norvegica]
MDKSECSICNDPFDGESHRPRALPCGHGCCTQCISTCILKGNTSCPICMKEYSANSATDLPVCYLLEDFIHTLAISGSQKVIDNSVSEIDSVEMCSKHKVIPLYFICMTHNIKVCHSCVVIDHPPASCNLISFNDDLKEMKQSPIEIVQIVDNQKQALVNIGKDLKNILQGNLVYLNEQHKIQQDYEKKVELLLTKIGKIKQDILIKEKSLYQIEDAIQECQINQNSLEFFGNNLKSVTSKQNIRKECEKASTEIIQCQKWEETLQNKIQELDWSKVTEAGDKYAQVEKNGVCRSCKIFVERGITFLPNLSNKVIPPRTARLVKVCILKCCISFIGNIPRYCNIDKTYGHLFCPRLRGLPFRRPVGHPNHKIKY